MLIVNKNKELFANTQTNKIKYQQIQCKQSNHGDSNTSSHYANGLNTSQYYVSLEALKVGKPTKMICRG